MMRELPDAPRPRRRALQSWFLTALLWLPAASGIASLRAQDLEPVVVGHWPSFGARAIRSLVVEDHLAYCGTHAGLVILDVGNPAESALDLPVVGTVLADRIDGLTVSGALVYAQTPNLVIFDASEPSDPREIGRRDFLLPAPPWSHGTPPFVFGDHVHLRIPAADGTANTIAVLDVSEPTEPRELSEYPAEPAGLGLRDFFATERYAYVTGRAGLSVIDIRDPVRPHRVSHLDGDFGSILVADGYAYVQVGIRQTSVIDVRDPLAPEVVGVFTGRVEAASAGTLVSSAPGTVTDSVWDVSDPTAPRAIGFFSAAVAVADLVLSGDRVYLASPTELQVIDIGGASYDAFLSTWGSGLGRGALAGDQAYFLTEDERLQLVDVSDPGSPRPTGSLALSPGPDEILFDVANDIAVSGGFVYVVGALYGLRVVNVTDPAQPRQIAAMLDEPGDALAVVDDLVLLRGRESFTTIDVSDPSAPRRIGSLELPWNEFLAAVVVSGSYAYVSHTWRDPLLVVDISEPSLPREVGRCEDCAAASSLVITGDTAYAMQGADKWIHLLDLSDPEHPLPLGSVELGGWVSASIISGDRLLAAGAEGLYSLDIGQPRSPRPQSFYHVPSQSGGIAVSGDIAFLLGGSLQVIDTRLPAPDPSPRIGLYETALDVADIDEGEMNTIHVLDGHANLHVFDVNDPSHPERLARFENTREAPPLDSRRAQVSVADGHAFIFDFMADFASGRPTVIEAVDIRDPSAPVSTGRLDTSFVCEYASLSDGYAYLVHGGDRYHLEVLDVRDPASMRPVGDYALDVAVSSVRGLYCHGDFAYLQLADGQEVIDVRDPTAPRRIRQDEVYALPLVVDGRAYVEYTDPNTPGVSGFQILDGVDLSTSPALGHYLGLGVPLFVSGERAYTFTEQGYQLIDVDDPLRPRLSGVLRSSRIELVRDDHVYATAPDSQFGIPLRSLDVIDVSRPAAFQRLGEGSALASPQNGGSPGAIALAGDVAFVADGTNGLEVFDLSSPAEPRRIGRHEVSPPGIVEDVAVEDDLAYLARGDQGLEILDVSEPGAPRPLGGRGDIGYALDVEVEDGRAFIAAFIDGLQIVDVGDPSSPRPLGSFTDGFGPPFSVYANSVAVSGGLAYVGGQPYLQVIDVSDPTRPRRVSRIDLGLRGGRLALGDGVVYVSSPGIHIIDVSNPADPRRLAWHPVAAFNLEVFGDHLYAMGDDGLRVLDVGDPEHPRLVGGNTIIVAAGPEGTLPWQLRSVPQDVAVQDGLAIATSGSWGVIALEPAVVFAPGDVIAEAIDGQLRLSWSAPRGGLPPAGYDVYRVAPGPRQRINAEPLAQTWMMIGGLAGHVGQCFVVVSRSASGATSLDSAFAACADPEAASARFRRGDCNDDRIVDISDAVATLVSLFLGGGAPGCDDACDSNDDGVMDISDAINTLVALFLGNAVIPLPGINECDVDPTDDELTCARHNGCP